MSAGNVATRRDGRPQRDRADDWVRIHGAGFALAIESRAPPLGAEALGNLVRLAPFVRLADGSPTEIRSALGALPSALLDDIVGLAGAFIALMGGETARVRLEALAHDGCTKLHSDYVDVRLITTYYGPGTDYAPDGDANAPLVRMATGDIGLFKGRGYGSGHPACLHRSPPIVATGERRLILVIDTPITALD